MKPNEITYKVYGRYALFSDPVTRIGGEKCSLSIPTYQALKGITESIYYKPSIIWYIDKLKIINPIKTESKGIRPIKYTGGNDLSFYTYLSDVEYVVTAHFIFNNFRPELNEDFNENKHYFITKRSLEKGGRRDIFLGTRECQGYVEPAVYEESVSCYKYMGQMDFGLMYHSLSYPSENGSSGLKVKFWYPKMNNGEIIFCKPEECPKERVIGDMGIKVFEKGNFSGVTEEGILDGYGGVVT